MLDNSSVTLGAASLGDFAGGEVATFGRMGAGCSSVGSSRTTLDSTRTEERRVASCLDSPSW
jgi:hypothetical protein